VALPLGEICAALEEAGKAGDGTAFDRLMRDYENAIAAIERRIGAVLAPMT